MLKNTLGATVLCLSLLGSAVVFAQPYETDPIYDDLRQRVFHQEITLGEDVINKDILMVMMEIGFAEGDGAATLTTWNDGTTSIFISNGGGITGAGEIPLVRDEVKRFFELATENLQQFTPSTEFPLANPGHIRFYVMKKDSTFTTELSEQEVQEQGHPLNPLFTQGHQIITLIRINEEQQKTGQPQTLHLDPPAH